MDKLIYISQNLFSNWIDNKNKYLSIQNDII